MTDLRRDHDAARAIAAAALGRDPGPMAAVESSSHQVYLSPDVGVKVIDAARHSRLDREIALAPHLSAGLTAPLLGSGLGRLGTREVRYACYARVPGTAPGMGLPGVDAVTARLLAEAAVPRLDELHRWIPADHPGPPLLSARICPGPLAVSRGAGDRASPPRRACDLLRTRDLLRARDFVVVHG